MRIGFGREGVANKVATTLIIELYILAPATHMPKMSMSRPSGHIMTNVAYAPR